MIVTCVHIYVKKTHIEDFIEATEKNHQHSVLEPGNLRFDVLQNENDPSNFQLYEAYESEASATAHKKTGHYQEWREQVANWMEKPREGIRYKIICPAEKSKW
ncbi:antibiotic biosynthesis monooxygenase [candidate division KSB1 bacterium]